jgi:hypothetical protein
MINHNKYHNDQRGVASLFLVIFAALLFTVITVGFAQMMVAEQANSLDNILSQSAYDSATAGVEDAKRSIIACVSGNIAAACTAVNSGKCYSNSYVTGVTGGDTILKSQFGDGVEINQAYTCVKITMNTPNYLGQLRLNDPLLIPLKGTSLVKSIRIEWQQNGDSSMPVDTTKFNDPTSPCHQSWKNLCSQSTWGNAPALLEAQLITPNANFKLQDLDADKSAGQTLYLRPYSAGANIDVASLRPRYTSDATITTGSPNMPIPVVCSLTAISGGYACSTTITGLSIPASSDIDFLRLAAVYRGANVRVTLLDASNNVVNFEAVQPDVDSTGRANDVYRRVDSRLEFGYSGIGANNPTIPNAAVDLGGSLCKDYAVSTTGVIQSGGCTP